MGIVEIMSGYPITSLIVVSVVVTWITTWIYSKFTDQEHLKSLKKRQKELQQQMKKDPSLMKELNAELFKISGTMMKESMKPLYITFIPMIFVFFLLKSIYVPVLGGSWIWYYIGFSLVSSIVIRKIMNVA